MADERKSESGAPAPTRSEGDAPSCHVCGSDMDFKCLKCGTVTGCAPAEPSEGTMICPACGSRERDPRHALATDSTNLYLCEHPWHSVIAVKAIKEWKAAESELTRLREAHRWIPVEEKLPPENNEYLVCEPDVGTTTADFRDGEWFTVRSFGQDCEERPLYAVTHWQPLPEPPTGAAQPDAQEKGK